ncbi:MAG: MOSC domain-containing protein [Aggregatilineales bacterium]
MTTGTLRSIVYKPKDAPHALRGYQRVALQEARLIADYGIQGDRKGGNPKRNLNVMDDITLAELAAEGYPTSPGVLGENLIISGIDLRTLLQGTCLQIGAEAIILLRALREPCQQLAELDARMPDSVVGRVGYMCRVVRGGLIRVGDPVTLVTQLETA